MILRFGFWLVVALSLSAALDAPCGDGNPLVGYYTIPQNGMYPGLPAGSRILTFKKAYNDASDVKRGDIVVFLHEQEWQVFKYIWRVIALPGEKVETSGESLVVNGRGVARQNLREADGYKILREQNGEATYEIALDKSPRTQPPDVSVTVPPKEFFVMGDNRFNAVDSRHFGTIKFSSIIGKKP